MAKKTYMEKLNDSKDMPKVETVSDPKAVERFGGERMLLAPPLAYDGVMKRVPEGKVTTTDRIREYLAKQHDADYTCQLTAGIFINTVAHANAERAGIDPTPYHRTLKKNGELNEKYPDGCDGQKALLEMEGHTVIQKGKKYFVQDYEKVLWAIEDESAYATNEDEPAISVPLDTPIKNVYQGKKVGRNEPCPCGSGNKFKRCCGNN